MAQPVWILSVDLQTKTATFNSGMADAAKSAKGSFGEIKSGATEMGGHVSHNMFATRHAVMAVSEAFGVQMPRAITALIAHVGPLGAALEAAFPFAAIGLAAVLLIEHFEELKAAGVKLTEDQVRFGTAAQTAFNTLDQKLLQAAIKTDELRNNHMGALAKQLEMIDRQSMDELVHTFGELAKAADTVFSDIKTHWYSFGTGATGAKHALDDFQIKYSALLAQGKDKEASDLLRGTRESAEKVAALQNSLKTGAHGKAGTGSDEQYAAQLKYNAESNELKKAGVGITDNEVKAVQTLVAALKDQETVEGKVAALKKADKGNATLETNKGLDSTRAEGQRQAAEHSQKMGELALAIEREQGEAALSIREATVAERLALDLHLADEETQLQTLTNQRLIAALDKGGKDYNNQLQALKDKGQEITSQHATTVAGLTAKATEAQYRQDLQDLEQGEREKIEATVQGSAERLAAIDAAIREEQSRNLQNTTVYRELLKQRVQSAREAAMEEAKAAAEAGKIEAENVQKTGELALAAAREQMALMDSARRVTIQQRIAEEVNAANQEFAIKLAAMQAETAALDKGSKDYQNKLKENQNKEKQLIQAHENEITAIKDKAEEERNKKIWAAESQFNDQVIAGLTQVLMGHKSFASMMGALGDQVVSGLIQNAIKTMEANMMGKESDAAKAARAAYNIGLGMGGPAGMILGPAFAAVAFSSMMAFESGTDRVPGVGTGDTVPAMLAPGEGVVPGGVMDGLRNMARSGGMGGGNQYHAHVSPVYNLQALDTAGMEKILDKHAGTLATHVGNELRKLNR